MNKEFVDWLIAEIEERDWSNSELARRAGISQSTVSMIIGGQNKPGLDFCVGVARAFKVPAEYVLALAKLIPSIPEETLGVREMTYLYDRLDETGQKNILDMMRGYVRERSKIYSVGKNPINNAEA